VESQNVIFLVIICETAFFMSAPSLQALRTMYRPMILIVTGKVGWTNELQVALLFEIFKIIEIQNIMYVVNNVDYKRAKSEHKILSVLC
jgi:hypothetical protein